MKHFNPSKVLLYSNYPLIASGPCKSTLTFVGTFHANGSIVASAIIYPDLRMPSDIAEQIPEEFYIGHSEPRCMKSANFYEYIGDPFITWLNEHIIPKPVILFIDGLSSHLTFQFSKQWNYAVFAPSNHDPHPGDVGLLKVLKHYWRDEVRKYQRENVMKLYSLMWHVSWRRCWRASQVHQL